MSYHTKTSLLVHCVFSTKNRLPLIRAEMRSRLWAYMGGIARTNSIKALAVGGMSDHVHLLLSLLPTMAPAKAIQLIKSGSSKWMHEQGVARFELQVGYGAFAVCVSQMRKTIHYIHNQEKHHSRRNFAQEWKIFLKAHGLDLD
jgi:putative transposase